VHKNPVLSHASSRLGVDNEVAKWDVFRATSLRLRLSLSSLGFDPEASFANGENVAGVRRTFISPVNRNFEE
jgi:hypothetical protein